MQTTLLGLGIAIILALVAALVGPYFVDWSDYRQAFEARASEAFGAPVRIRGSIDLRLLPTPYVVLRDVELAQAEEGAHLRAQELEVTFSLGPLLRGTWRATELRLEGPDVGLRLGKDGRLVWPGRQAQLDPASLSIDRLIVEHGRVDLYDTASGGRAVLEGVSFDGDARSLLGPVRGDGGFAFDGRQHRFRLSAGRANPAGEVKLRLDIERAQDPLNVEADGTLSLSGAKPRFEGTFAVAREAGVVLVAGRAIANQPWRLSGRVKIGAAEALIQQLELIYGPEERGLKLAGTANLKLGAQPRLEALLSAHQLDLDKFVALPESSRRLPAVALRAAAAMTEGLSLPAMPVRIGIGIDAVTLGEGIVTDVRGDLRSDPSGGWAIETMEFRAPGLTRVRASGRLSAVDDGYAFTGPARVEAADPRMLTAWLEGRKVPRGPVAAPLRAQGEVTFTPQRLAVERLSAEVDRNPISGRFDYQWPTPVHPRPRLEAELKAKELDIDAAQSLVRSALPGASLDVPGEVVLALDIGRAIMAGVEAIDAKAKLRFDANGLALEQVHIGNLAGVSLGVSGRIEGPWEAPAGTVSADIEGTRLDGVSALLAKIAPKSAAWLNRQAGRLTPAKLHLTLALQRLQPDASASVAKLSIDGRAGTLRVAVGAEAQGTMAQWQNARLRTDGRIETGDARVLAAILGIEPVFTPASGTGALGWVATGPLGGSLAVQGQFTAPGAELSANGTLSLGPDTVADARAEIAANIADVAALRGAFGRPEGPLPVAVKAQLSFDDDRVLFTGVSGKVADSAISGRLALRLADPLGLDGRLEADSLDASALVGALAGAPTATRKGASSGTFTAEPFGARFLKGVEGRIELAAASAKLWPGLAMHDASALLRLTPGEASLENVNGGLAGGRLQGSLSLQASPLGTAAAARIAVSGADIAALWPKQAGAPARGRISFQLDAKGHGRSPAALIGSLGGSGTVSFEQVEIPSLSADAFAAAMRSADQRNEVVADAVKTAVTGALDHGAFKATTRMEGALTLSAGEVRVGSLAAQSERADLSVNATLDLAQSQLDARLALVDKTEELGAAGRPEIGVLLRGPFEAPRRDVDVSALVGWLTLRAVDMQAKRLQEAEAQRRRAEEAIQRANAAAAARRAAEEEARRAAEAQARREAEEIMRPPSGPTPAAPAPPAEQAPALPPPIDIKPAPGQRRTNAARPSPQASAERPPAAERQAPRPAADIPANRSMLDLFLRPAQ